LNNFDFFTTLKRDLDENECPPKNAESQPVDTECQSFEKSHSEGQPGCDSESIKLTFRVKLVSTTE
jgi:hypothetical protein